MLAPPPTARELVKLKRVKLGLSARAVSVAAGQSGSYVSKLEAGQLEPSLKAFARLAKVLEMNAQEIYMIAQCEAAEAVNETEEA